MIYQATWYDYAAAKALAVARGMTDKDGDDNILDYTEPETEKGIGRARRFPSKGLAVAFLQREILAKGVDIWSQCEVLIIEKMPRRCRYCTCHGEQITRRFWVEADELGPEESCESECLDD